MPSVRALPPAVMAALGLGFGAARAETGAPGDTASAGDTRDSSETGETGDSGDSGDSGDTNDSGETGVAVCLSTLDSVVGPCLSVAKHDCRSDCEDALPGLSALALVALGRRRRDPPAEEPEAARARALDRLPADVADRLRRR